MEGPLQQPAPASPANVSKQGLIQARLPPFSRHEPWLTRGYQRSGNWTKSTRVPDALRHPKAMRSIADDAAAQSRDRNEALPFARSRFCEAALRKGFALHRVRETRPLTPSCACLTRASIHLHNSPSFEADGLPDQVRQ
jgi:hypothetical protein